MSSSIPKSPPFTHLVATNVSYERFRKVFIDEGLRRSRKMQVSRLKHWATQPGLVGHTGKIAVRNWEDRRKIMYEDCKRVLKELAKPDKWTEFRSMISGDFERDMAKHISDGPIDLYLGMLQIAYSILRGAPEDYALMPRFIKSYWTRDQFNSIMDAAK